jgi:aspartate/methionine/tyrosine aminotransferase
MPAQIEPFRAIAIGRLAYALQASGRSIIHMEFGQPSTGAPREAIEAAHRVLDTDPMGYWESPELKAALATHYRDTYGTEVDADQFILTCGASPALVLALAANFEPGQRIAMARPGYVAYRNTARALHLQPVEIACGPATRFQLTAASLRELDPPPAGVILASPANPTGTLIPAPELQRIAQVCSEKRIRIISDEIYHGLSYVEPARSALEFDPAAFVISSFSKYFSMVGWRLGWLLAPRDQVERMRMFSGNMFLSAPSLSQHAALVALRNRADLDNHLATYRDNRDLLLDALSRMGLREIAPPDGAFYIYANIGHLTDDSFSFCERLLRETGVATAPGVDFDPVAGRQFIRFSFAISTAETQEAIQRLRSWIARQ